MIQLMMLYAVGFLYRVFRFGHFNEFCADWGLGGDQQEI